MLSAFHGLNTGILLFLWLRIHLPILAISKYYFIAGFPYLQSRLKGPKWVPFLVGVRLECLILSSICFVFFFFFQDARPINICVASKDVLIILAFFLFNNWLTRFGVHIFNLILFYCLLCL